jgi:hypothetical protein
LKKKKRGNNIAGLLWSWLLLFLLKTGKVQSIIKGGVGVMVFIATFNNISVTAWQSVLLVEETRIPGYIFFQMFLYKVTKYTTIQDIKCN